MEREKALTMANDLLIEHNLPNVTVKITHGKTVYATAIFNRHSEPERITISGPFIDHNDQYVVRNTILHEIAHFIAGHQAAHGPAWKRIAERIGARPERINTIAIRPPRKKREPRFKAYCPRCKRVVATRIKRSKRISQKLNHSVCGTRIKWWDMKNNQWI